MKRLVFLYVMLFLSLIVNSQNITIKGKVIDASNKKALQYVNIFIKGTNIGTVSNIEGEFDFNIPIKYEMDSITFSFIGYQKKTIKINKIITNILIELPLYVYCFNDLIVEDKKPDPYDIIFYAFKNDNNRRAFLYSCNVFTRNIIKKDTKFISYRKTITKTTTNKDNIWFHKGNILADIYLTTNEINSAKKNVDIYSLNEPPEYSERYYRKYKKRKELINVIDTVIFTDTNKIYIIDIYNNKIDTNIIKKIKNTLSLNSAPYELINSTSVDNIGNYFLNNSKVIFNRYYIDGKNNFNIIKSIILIVDNMALGSNKITFEYDITEYTNEPKNSHEKYSLSYKQNFFINEDDTTQFKSIFESFCYNFNYINEPIIDDGKLENDSTIFYKFVKANNYGKEISYDKWGDNQNYIKPDSLELKAIKQIENRIKNEK